IVHVHAAVAQTRAQTGEGARALALLDTACRVGRLADPAVDQALQPDLRVVVDVRAPDLDVEQRRDILAVLRFDAGPDVPLQPRDGLRDLALGRGGHAGGRHVE